MGGKRKVSNDVRQCKRDFQKRSTTQLNPERQGHPARDNLIAKSIFLPLITLILD